MTCQAKLGANGMSKHARREIEEDGAPSVAVYERKSKVDVDRCNCCGQWFIAEEIDDGLCEFCWPSSAL